MLRESPLHAQLCDLTMSNMQRKQFEACLRRLLGCAGPALFSAEATDADAQRLLENSYYHSAKTDRLMTLDALKAKVLKMMPEEVKYIASEERALLELLIILDNRFPLRDCPDASAAESLVKRLWCGIEMDGEEPVIFLPKKAMELLMDFTAREGVEEARERCFHFESTFHGILYLSGLLYAPQTLGFFRQSVIQEHSETGDILGRRLLMASFEYLLDQQGEMLLVHPGLTDPYRLLHSLGKRNINAMELDESWVKGSVEGILPEEIPLEKAMARCLKNQLWPEIHYFTATEDIRMLIKQGYSLEEVETVMRSMLMMTPGRELLSTLQEQYRSLPRWLGIMPPMEQTT